MMHEPTQRANVVKWIMEIIIAYLTAALMLGLPTLIVSDWINHPIDLFDVIVTIAVGLLVVVAIAVILKVRISSQSPSQ
jgi:hypothetical protein